MSQSKLEELFDRIELLQQEIEQEIDHKLEEKRELFQYTLNKGKVRFEKRIHEIQIKYKKGILPYLRDAKLSHILSAPIIYSVIIPIALLDLSVSFYQHTCFRVYGIERVDRSNYVIIDRQHLVYLNTIEKINCMYCGYGNGVIAFVREVFARTEQYWCPIKHASKQLDAHQLTEKFTDYGDAKAYQEKLITLRKALSQQNEIT